MTWGTDRLDALKSGQAVAPPVTRTLRMGLLDDWGEGWVRKSWVPSADLLNGDGSLFGGYLAALADQVLSFAAISVVPDDMHFRTLNLQVNYLRVGWADSLTIEGRVVARTRQLITVRAEFRRPDGELIAEASAQQLLLAMSRLPSEAAALEAMRADPTSGAAAGSEGV